ncbi:MAG: pseudouridine synthase [Candidatus Handelsmanbacteria bacterium RIFCSPLOWO2_12_FULL_64_10]|uniref:Pseudouridine synthase n=1 Tax=Handelsmanbacteria sp. (strain RIFCSPLOWO2_12_FULL_64_10) TaxID=1817868 RepID=A0A1F6C3J2_HANXR|nr:MAG: pseudouridine synthase [Candidatus Handelsmanbacteria bacterium RIFCSPLOWO2_12_FULL_64_10]
MKSSSRQPPRPRRPKVSLPRALSKLGHCSRTQAQALIAAGRVQVNGRARTDAALRVDLERDRIEVDGRRLAPADKVYLMLNKPRGLVTTASDEEGRPTVYTCLPEHPYLAPVGRLDKASEGLLLFTNDTRWADHILSPGSHIEKVYHVQVDGPADEALLQQMVEGVTDEEDFLAAKRVSVLRRGGRNTWLEVVLDEGKHRHIRRLLIALGVEVLRLVRVAVGPLTLGDLTKGKYRRLTDEERRALENAAPSARKTR